MGMNFSNSYVATATQIADTIITSGKLAFTPLEVVSSTTVSGGAVSEISMTGLDLDTDGMYYIVMNLLSVAGNALDPYIEVNGDSTSTNYYVQWCRSNNAAWTGARYNAPAVSTGIAGEGYFMQVYMVRSPSGKPRAQITANYQADSAITQQDVAWIASTAANVTSIQVAEQTSNAYIDNGSTVTIYKVGT